MEIVLTHAINKINNDKGAQQQVGDERKESLNYRQMIQFEKWREETWTEPQRQSSKYS